jgi:hypothetical protein
MRIPPLRLISAAIIAVAALSIFVVAALAFDNPLSPEAIREAYFLAKGDAGKRDEFFAKYTHQLPTPQSGPDIASVELETPFARVVDDIALNKLNYHAPDAQQDYYGKPAQFLIRVQVYFTPTWPAAGPAQLAHFWNDFHIHLKQAKEIASQSETGTPIYNDQAFTGYTGATIAATYDAGKIRTGPATVEVTGPEGVRAETSFDLDSLR